MRRTDGTDVIVRGSERSCAKLEEEQQQVQQTPQHNVSPITHNIIVRRVRMRLIRGEKIPL